jgi:hypothetical protein
MMSILVVPLCTVYGRLDPLTVLRFQTPEMDAGVGEVESLHASAPMQSATNNIRFIVTH